MVTTEIAGGVADPDKLRMIPEAVAFVRHFVQASKRSRRSAKAPRR